MTQFYGYPPHGNTGTPPAGTHYPNQSPYYGQGQINNWQTPGIGQTAPWNRFIKGALIGAAATYLLTNEQVQRTAIMGLVKAWSLVQSGVEEVKERFGDAQAEVQHTQQQHKS